MTNEMTDLQRVNNVLLNVHLAKMDLVETRYKLDEAEKFLHELAVNLGGVQQLDRLYLLRGKADG